MSPETRTTFIAILDYAVVLSRIVEAQASMLERLTRSGFELTEYDLLEWNAWHREAAGVTVAAAQMAEQLRRERS